ncbi:hypothetical protein J2X02_002350 [Pseudoxanthomonas japonensis]|uniref:hypothetical protein n=1 Tax=Pseudoxanthomonas japonensis TaxID=69284 RepID=UPI002864AB9C|nr:hypothetical protein [Pseudoxanthomonas japonensis]MDR7069499.1 hypothetical protein [Pseudoxanthomonas japonensis]
MYDFFKSELLRFRGWALLAALVHLLSLAFMARVVDLAQQPLVVHWVIGGVYALAGLLLGLYQMGSYRKPSQWVSLLHRPMAPRRIAFALATAASVLLAVAVALPLLAIATWQETLTPRVVDLRHWLLPLSGWLIATAAYLAGAFCSLRGWRWAGAALALLVWLLVSRAYGPSMIAIEVVVLVWLALLLRIAFVADLDSPPRSALATAAVALPLQAALYLLVLVLLFCLEMVWVAQGSHPNNTPTPPVGGHNEVEKMDARDRMIAGLLGSRHPDAPLLREQIRLSDPEGLGVQVPKLPQYQELANFRPMEFDDGERRERWVFSHDDMRLHGYRLAYNRDAGTLGVGPAQAPFKAVVLPGDGMPGMEPGDATLIGGDTLYQYRSAQHDVAPRLRAAPGETLMGGGPLGQGVGMLSDRALYFYDGRRLAEGQGIIAPRLRVPLPGAMGDLRSLDLIELVDGHLIALAFSAESHADGAAPVQITLRTHDDGRIETVHRRALAFDYPPAYRYRHWWPSPLLSTVAEWVRNLFAPPLPLDVTAPAPRPASMTWLAGVLSLLAVIGAVWRTARTGLSVPARCGWIVACALVGLPALGSLWLLVPRRDVVADVPLPEPATA